MIENRFQDTLEIAGCENSNEKSISIEEIESLEFTLTNSRTVFRSKPLHFAPQVKTSISKTVSVKFKDLLDQQKLSRTFFPVNLEDQTTAYVWVGFLKPLVKVKNCLNGAGQAETYFTSENGACRKG